MSVLIMDDEIGFDLFSEPSDKELALLLEELKKTPENAYLVYEWRFAPQIFRETFRANGGDEDWIVITRDGTHSWTPLWIERMDSCGSPDEYKINEFLVFVGSHS